MGHSAGGGDAGFLEGRSAVQPGLFLRPDVRQDALRAVDAPETEAAAYRIVQEALTNVAKHARATLAFVYLQQRDDIVLIRIEDNGIGFEPGGARRGLGLIGIRERVANLRGVVRVDSAPGKGTRLTVELPARARAANADNGEFDSQDATHAPVTTSEVLLG